MRFYKVGGAGEEQCSWRRVPRHRTEGGGGWVGSAGFAAERAGQHRAASDAGAAQGENRANMAGCAGIGCAD